MNALLSGPDLPAWLQAFAAIVAIFISVWAAIRAGGVEQHRDRLQALGIAVAISPELLKLGESLKNCQEKLSELAKFNETMAGAPMGVRVQALQIPIPPMLDRNVDRLFVLGKRAGPSCLQLVNELLQYNSLVEDITNRTMMLGIGQWAPALSQIDEHLILLKSVVAKCEQDVRPLHDAIKT